MPTTVISALEAIEQAPLGNERLKVLKEVSSPELIDILTFAVSPDITFGVKVTPTPNTSDPGNADDDWYRTFIRLLEELADRKLSGNAARRAIEFHLERYTLLQQKWAHRIIKQDLRLNLGAKDINRALGANTIPIFQVPLATDYKKVPETKLLGHWYIQPKYDGARVVAVLPTNQGRVKLLSRTGKEWDNFESIRLELQEMNNARKGPTLYLDGEVVSIQDGKIDFQALQKTMMRDDGLEVGTLNYIMFDAATGEEWNKSQWPYSQRYLFAEEVHMNVNPSIIKMVPNQRTDLMTYQLAEQYCNRYTVEGYEGAMIRRSDKPVENKRSKLLLKVKTFQDAEAEIIGQVEGTGKYIGMLGALVCKAENGKEFEIGTGLDDAQRKDMWNSVVGQKVTYKFQNLTDDQVPRFPVFKGIRHSKELVEE